MKFTNENVLKEERGMKRNIFISILIMFLCIPCFIVGGIVDNNKLKDRRSLYDIIVDNETTSKEMLYTYIDIKKQPFKFAIYEDTTDAYYFVTDGEYIYVAYMSLSQYNELYDEDSSSLVKVEGVTALVPKDVKEIAIETYNEMFELSDENSISIVDYDSYFGSVSIDMTSKGNSSLVYIFGLLFILIGFIALLINCIRYFVYKSGVKKLGKDLIIKLDEEMNNSESFFYDGSNLYLTPNYIINFGIYFSVIKYEDVVLMYISNQRVYGIKATQCIFVRDIFGNFHNIAETSAITKSNKEQLDEIFNTIANKNENILIGYNNENLKEAKKRIKEYKSLNKKK